MPSTDVFSRRFYNAGTVESPVWAVPAGTVEIRIAIDIEGSTTRTWDMGGEIITTPAIGTAAIWDQTENPVARVVGEGSFDGAVWEECYRKESTWQPIQGRQRIYKPYTHLRGRLELRSRERLTLRIDFV